MLRAQGRLYLLPILSVINSFLLVKIFFEKLVRWLFIIYIYIAHPVFNKFKCMIDLCYPEAKKK